MSTPTLAARRLLRAARAGTLATTLDGQPFASLVTPATEPGGDVLLLLSGLSEHTRHLLRDPRCSLLVSGAPAEANPQTAPRLTLTGLAAPEPEPALKARWLARHPYAGFYAGLDDFRLWRLRPGAGLFIGGFASAHRLRAADLAPDPHAVAEVAAAEARILGHCNDDHADALDAIAAMSQGGGEGWRMVACDVDGFDLARGDVVLRIPWSRPVANSASVRSEMVALTQAARAEQSTGAGRGVSPHL